MTTQALEKAGSNTPAVITTTDEYQQALERWSKDYNVLTPFSNMSGIAPSFGLMASVVKLNPDAAAGEVYSGTTAEGKPAMPFLKGDRGKPNEELAIAKVGLRKLAECGGISTDTTRTDPRTIPNYWEFKATATYRGLDGSTITRSATFEWDLRNGSDRMKGWQPNQITEARKNGLRACEARAINAAIRECGCGIKQKYTRAELDKPFVVIRVAFQPDMSDPAVKSMVTQRALDGTSAMYSHREQPAVQGDGFAEDGGAAPRQVGSGSTVAPTTAAPAAEPPLEKPMYPEGYGLVQKIWTEEKTRRDKTGTFAKWHVVDFAGVEHVTIKGNVGEGLKRCFEQKIAVDIVSEENSYQELDITEWHPLDDATLFPTRKL